MLEERSKEYINWDKVEESKPDVGEKKILETRQMIDGYLNRWSSAVQISMSPREPEIQRTEGEVWFDYNGKKWTRKNGINQTVTHSAHAVMPWWCPKCSKPMNNRFDRKFYYIRGWCYNCNIDYEGDLRAEGKFEAYEKKLMRANEKDFLRDKIEEHLTYIREFKDFGIQLENGEYQVLAGKEQFEVFFESLRKDIDFMTSRLAHIAKEEEAETLVLEQQEKVHES